MTYSKNPHIIELTIEAMGQNGDGIGYVQAKPVYVPYGAIGDRMQVQLEEENKAGYRARIVTILENSPERQEPFCHHFGQCGGCALQHLTQEAYESFKTKQLIHLLSRLNVVQERLLPMVNVGKQARRRVEWKVSVSKQEITLGYFQAKTHDVVDIVSCPVTHPDIVQLLAPLKQWLRSLKKPALIKSIHMTRLGGDGLDMLIETAQRMVPIDRGLLTEWLAHYIQVKRVVLRDLDSQQDTIVLDRGVYIDLSGVRVELPIGAFLQATEIGQNTIAQFITHALQSVGAVIDLYSGCGTYSFALAQEGHSVAAYEGDQAMVFAIHNAANKASLHHKVMAHTRNLYKDPVQGKALEGFEAAVINPPRNGATPQIQALARSNINHIVMVSCNISTCERDAAILLAQGYHLISIQAIDQFYMTSHLEVVSYFRKGL